MEPNPSYLYGGENVGFDARKDFGDFTDINFDDGSILLIGNEANGLTESAKKMANMQIAQKISSHIMGLTIY